MKVKDFARLAGVSSSTISKIMHHKDENINPATKERILNLAKECGFLPLQVDELESRSLQVAVLLRSFDHPMQVIGYLEEGERQGYHSLVLSSISSYEEERRQINLLIARKLDGILWEPILPLNEDSKKLLEESKIPFFIVESSQDIKPLDYEKMAYFITNELIGLGHRHIACYTEESRNGHKFHNGYCRALVEHELKIKTEFSSFTKEEMEKQFLQDLAFTGIVSISAKKGEEVQKICEEHSYSIPERISLLSLRGDEEGENRNPYLSAYIIPHRRFSSYCMQKLISRVENGESVKEKFSYDFSILKQDTMGAPVNEDSQKVVLVGSINVDHYLIFPSLPESGKTVTTRYSSQYPGGKCLNQSIGLKRLGITPLPIGIVGEDADSNLIYSTLHKEHIDCSGIERDKNVQTGRAYIFVQKDGDSMISVASGANALLDAAYIQKNKALFAEAQYCLMQTEVSTEALFEACLLCKKRKIQTILKPSACSSFPDEVLPLLDCLVPNKSEIMELVPEAKDYKEAAQYFLKKGVKNVIVTLGMLGCYFVNKDREKSIQGISVSSVDSTGAGDAFISAFVAYLLKGYSLDFALEIANCAGAYSSTQQGASSLADKDTLENFIMKFKPEIFDLL